MELGSHSRTECLAAEFSQQLLVGHCLSDLVTLFRTAVETAVSGVDKLLRVLAGSPPP